MVAHLTLSPRRELGVLPADVGASRIRLVWRLRRTALRDDRSVTRIEPSYWRPRAWNGRAPVAPGGRAAGNRREGELDDRAGPEDEAMRRAAALEVPEFLTLLDVIEAEVLEQPRGCMSPDPNVGMPARVPRDHCCGSTICIPPCCRGRPKCGRIHSASRTAEVAGAGPATWESRRDRPPVGGSDAPMASRNR